MLQEGGGLNVYEGIISNSPHHGKQNNLRRFELSPVQTRNVIGKGKLTSLKVQLTPINSTGLSPTGTIEDYKSNTLPFARPKNRSESGQKPQVAQMCQASPPTPKVSNPIPYN